MASQLNSIVFNNTDFEAFEEPAEAKGTATGTAKKAERQYVHIRVQQRNGRKSLTTITGLATDLDLKKILKALKKVLSCNGTVLQDEEVGAVLQLQGDQRKAVVDFFCKYSVCTKEEIKVHGF